MLQILIFLAILSLVVFFHEMGHFIAAKRLGVSVEEFGFGYPPRLFGKKWRGTTYSVNLIPFGGFVRLKGENAEFSGLGDADSFQVKSPRRRLLILIAGVAGNFILAWLIFWLLFSIGMPTFEDYVLVEGVVSGSPAEEAGIAVGDIIARLDDQEVSWASEITEYVTEHTGQPLTVTVVRDGKMLVFDIVPEPLLGVEITNIRLRQTGILVAPIAALGEVARLSTLMVGGIAQMVVQIFKAGGVPDAVAGPVGIYKLTEFYRSLGFRYLLQFVGLLSVNLGLINLLPIPALDGGRLLFVGYEILAKRRIPARVERIIHSVGFFLIIALTALVTIKDIRTLF